MVEERTAFSRANIDVEIKAGIAAGIAAWPQHPACARRSLSGSRQCLCRRFPCHPQKTVTGSDRIDGNDQHPRKWVQSGRHNKDQSPCIIPMAQPASHRARAGKIQLLAIQSWGAGHCATIYPSWWITFRGLLHRVRAGRSYQCGWRLLVDRCPAENRSHRRFWGRIAALPLHAHLSSHPCTPWRDQS